MFNLFTRYVSVGVINTAIHWAVFLALYMTGINQATSNLAAFLVAVTFSFFANARFTFKGQVTSGRYLIYLAFMGGMAVSVGQMSDYMQMPALFTLVTFSAVSLVMGFFYSKYVVFRKRK